MDTKIQNLQTSSIEFHSKYINCKMQLRIIEIKNVRIS